MCSRPRTWSWSELSDGEFTGRGEAAGVYYLGDDSAHIVAELEAHRERDRELAPTASSSAQLMPRGGARNAVDCALWDLEAKREGTEARRLARIESARPLITTFTLGADEPQVMARVRSAVCDAQAIKVKLTGELGPRHRAGRGDPGRPARRLARSRRKPGLHARGCSTRSSMRLASTACRCSSSR